MLGGWRKEKAGFETDSNLTHRQSSLYNVGCVRMRLSIDQGQNEIERTRKAEIRNTELPATRQSTQSFNLAYSRRNRGNLGQYWVLSGAGFDFCVVVPRRVDIQNDSIPPESYDHRQADTRDVR